MHIFIGCLVEAHASLLGGCELTGNELVGEILRKSQILKGRKIVEGCGLIKSREEAVTMLLTNLVPIYKLAHRGRSSMN